MGHTAPNTVFLVYRRKYHRYEEDDDLDTVWSVHATLKGAIRAAASYLEERPSHEDFYGSGDIVLRADLSRDRGVERNIADDIPRGGERA